MTVAQCFLKRGVAEFTTFLLAVCAGSACPGGKVLHLMRDHGSTHTPRQLAAWTASLNLSCEVRTYGLPTSTSW
jgi:hypothetical protein